MTNFWQSLGKDKVFLSIAFTLGVDILLAILWLVIFHVLKKLCDKETIRQKQSMHSEQLLMEEQIAQSSLRNIVLQDRDKEMLQKIRDQSYLEDEEELKEQIINLEESKQSENVSMASSGLNIQSKSISGHNVIHMHNHLVLDKMERKMNLDETVEDWNRLIDAEGPCDWLKLLSRIDDQKLQRICGTDTSLYLIFLRYSAIFFGWISFVNLIFIWIFITGKPLAKDDYRIEHALTQYQLQAMTILNVSATPPKVTLCFLNSMLTIVGMCFFLIFKFMNKFKDKSEPIVQDDRKVLLDLHQIAQNPQLLEDEELNKKIYSENEISEHTIMLQNLPKNMAKNELEGHVLKVFQELLGIEKIEANQIIKVRVVSKLHKCKKWIEKLKQYQGKYLTAQKQNQAQGQRMTITKKRWFRRSQNYDAVLYYSKKIIDLKLKIKNEEKLQLKSNAGLCFVIFRSKQISMRFKIQSYLTEKLKRIPSFYEKKLDLMKIKTSEAIFESDLIWENLGKDQTVAMFKRAILFLLLVLFSLLVLTPINAISLMDPFKFALQNLFQVTLLQQLITTYFAPLIVILVNFVIIPSIIDFSVLFEDHYLQSGIQASIMNRIYFFMLLNTLLIPITEASTALYLFEELAEMDTTEWPSMLSSNMMAQQYFYIKFIIQLTFVTNGLSLLDVPHRLVKWIKMIKHERNQRDLIEKQPFIDDYSFDLGYNQSYCLVIFLNCLLFSTIVPIIPFFACLYFWIKYFVDKYNLVFVYFKKHESGGKIRGNVKNFILMNLYFYMAVIISFFSLKFSDKDFEWFGLVLVLLWTALYYYISSKFSDEEYIPLPQDITFKKTLIKQSNLMKLEQSYQHPFEHEDKSIYLSGGPMDDEY